MVQAGNKTTRSQGQVPGLPRLLGGKICLDFVNTIEGRLSAQPIDILSTFDALVDWGYHVNLLTHQDRSRLVKQASQSPDQAQKIWKQALELREALYRVFLALMQQVKPATQDLAILKDCYTDGLSQCDLVQQGEQFDWQWQAVPTLNLVTWKVAQSAVDFLHFGEIHRIKQCPGCDDCGWLFLDTSKSGTRQWCSMEGCGSRAKMRRHYQRVKHQTT